MADEEIWVCSMAYIQVTTRCNMFCEHCGFSCTAEGEDMSMEVFERTLQVFEGSYITIGGGEPTLHPKIFEMVLGIIMLIAWGVLHNKNSVEK